MNEDLQECVIIGAGMSGLLLAKELNTCCKSIIILEGSNSFGGQWKEINLQSNYLESSFHIYKTKNITDTHNVNLSQELSNIVSNFPESIKIQYNSKVQRVFNDGECENISYELNGKMNSFKCKKVFVCCNILKQSYSLLKNEDIFEGPIFNIDEITSDTFQKVNFENKRVLLLGVTHESVDLIRLLFDKKIRFICLINNSDKTKVVAPSFVDYIQHIRPQKIDLSFDESGTNTLFSKWKEISKLCCIQNLNPDFTKNFNYLSSIGKSVDLYFSDYWFIAHYFGLIESFDDDISEVYPNYIVSNKGNKIDCDIIINCSLSNSLEENKTTFQVFGRDKISDNGVIRKNLIFMKDFEKIGLDHLSFLEYLELKMIIYKRLMKNSDILPEGDISKISSYSSLSFKKYLDKKRNEIDLISILLDNKFKFYDTYSTPPDFIKGNKKKWDEIVIKYKSKALINEDTYLPYTVENMSDIIYKEWSLDEFVIGNLESLKSDDTIYEKNNQLFIDYNKIISEKEVNIVDTELLESKILDVSGYDCEIKDSSGNLLQLDSSGNFDVIKILEDFRNKVDSSTHKLEKTYTESLSGNDLSGNDLSGNDISGNVSIQEKTVDEIDLQKESERFFSSGFWRLLYITKKFVQRLPSFEVTKFDMEYAAVIYSNYLRMSYKLDSTYTPETIINAYRNTVEYHSILKTISDNIVMLYSVYDCNLNEKLFPAMKLNVDQKVIMLDFHIYNDRLLMNASFDCLFFDMYTIQTFLFTVNDNLYNSGSNPPTKLNIMYNPIQYSSDYFDGFSNFLIDVNANMTLSALSGIIYTQSDLHIEEHFVVNMKELLQNYYSISLTEYSLVSFIYSLFMFEIYKHKMVDTDTFSIINTQFVRNTVSPNSLGNFIYWHGPDVKTKADIVKLSIIELLNWWITGNSVFDVNTTFTKPNLGNIMIIFEDWTMFESLNSTHSELYYDTITFFPIGERHIDCSKTNKMKLNIIKKDGYYKLSKAFQCSGIDIDSLWYKVRCCFQKYFTK